MSAIHFIAISSRVIIDLAFQPRLLIFLKLCDSSEDKMKRTNFSSCERERFLEIMGNFSIIEDKRKTPDIEMKKRGAWSSIVSNFNSDENNVPRDELQLKVSRPYNFLFTLFPIFGN